MQIAIFSDVHGNLAALEAVLDQVGRLAPDLVVFAGDLCLFGSRAAACINELRGRKIISVYGNTDLWVLDPPVPPEDSGDRERRHRQNLYEISKWTRSQLSDVDLEWLRQLPFEFRVSPTSDMRDDLLIVHANPRDVNQVIFPTAVKQKALFGRVKQEQSDDEVAPLLEDVVASVIAFGHLHVPNVRHWRDMILANISSVSLSGDGDPRAKYALLTWEKGKGWAVQHQRVSYELQKEIDAAAEAGLPDWHTYARRLEKAGAR